MHSIESNKIAFARHAEEVICSVDNELVDEDLAAGARLQAHTLLPLLSHDPSNGCALEPASAINHLLGQSLQMVEQVVDCLRCLFLVADNYMLGDRAMEL